MLQEYTFLSNAILSQSQEPIGSTSSSAKQKPPEGVDIQPTENNDVNDTSVQPTENVDLQPFDNIDVQLTDDVDVQSVQGVDDFSSKTLELYNKG